MGETLKSLGYGLIGTGFIGKVHALAARNARAVFGAQVPEIRMEMLCDTPADRAARMASQFGFARSAADWRAMVEDPAVDVISITTPNGLHKEIALAALAAGKAVWCEKPLALTIDDAREMAAAAVGRPTQVGYNYIQNPAYRHAQRLVAQGRIGRIVHIRGIVDEDYQADPDLPWTWRARRSDAGLGALGDLGCHLISLVVGLAGPIDSLIADTQIIHESRPLPDGSGRAAVENEDTATAILRFASGAQGSVSCSRSVWGRKNRLDVEVHGTKGVIAFGQERMNELQLYVDEGPVSEAGFRTILTGPAHPPYGEFIPAPGHQLGFIDLKTIEAARFFAEVAGGDKAGPDFAEALVFEEAIHAIDRAAASGERVSLASGD